MKPTYEELKQKIAELEQALASTQEQNALYKILIKNLLF